MNQLNSFLDNIVLIGTCHGYFDIRFDSILNIVRKVACRLAAEYDRRLHKTTTGLFHLLPTMEASAVNGSKSEKSLCPGPVLCRQ